MSFNFQLSYLTVMKVDHTVSLISYGYAWAKLKTTFSPVAFLMYLTIVSLKASSSSELELKKNKV